MGYRIYVRKNGHGKAWYDKDEEAVRFLDYWNGKSKQREPYPVSRAWMLRDLACDRARQHGLRIDYQANRRMNAAYAIMAFTEDITLTREQNAYGLHLVYVDNLAAHLRALDARHENVNQREMPGDHDERPFSPLILDAPKQGQDHSIGQN